MNPQAVFHYRIDGRAAGRRPGAHAGRAAGAGHDFLAHARLFDHPDPRRLDLRASLRSGGTDWLVRTHRQRSAITLQAVVDVSASMACGAPRKLDIAASLVESMGSSAFKTGDAAGLTAFDRTVRHDLCRPAQHSRAIGASMASLLRAAQPGSGAGCGVLDALQPLAGRQAMVFLVSDFHWPPEILSAALALLAHAWVVPVVIWDTAETTPPGAASFVRLRDAETGQRRSLWLTPRLRDQWIERVAARRRELDALFAARQLRALYVSGHFDAAQVSAYFLDCAQ